MQIDINQLSALILTLLFACLLIVGAVDLAKFILKRFQQQKIKEDLIHLIICIFVIVCCIVLIVINFDDQGASGTHINDNCGTSSNTLHDHKELP